MFSARVTKPFFSRWRIQIVQQPQRRSLYTVTTWSSAALTRDANKKVAAERSTARRVGLVLKSLGLDLILPLIPKQYGRAVRVRTEDRDVKTRGSRRRLTTTACVPLFFAHINWFAVKRPMVTARKNIFCATAVPHSTPPGAPAQKGLSSSVNQRDQERLAG